MKRPLCPILLIGFNPPKEGQRDLRRCNKECAWFDEENDQCCIQTCAEFIPVISGQLDDVVALSNDLYPSEEDFDYNATKHFK